MKPEAKHNASCAKPLEPELRRVLWSVRAHEPFHGSEHEAEIAWEVAQLIEEFEPESADSNCRSLWFTVERGSIDDWKTIEKFREYAEWEELEIEESRLEAERASEWEELYPDDSYWHELSYNRFEDRFAISIDNRVIISVDPDVKNDWEHPVIGKCLRGLKPVVSAAVDMARHGDYAQYLEENLHPSLRYGLIRRKDYWGIVGKERCFDDWKMGEEEAEDCARVLMVQPGKESIGRVEELSARQYFDALKGAYIACGYENGESRLRGIPAEDGRSWYARIGDARDRSLLEIDQDSPEAFRAWFIEPGRFFNHTFEVFGGFGGACVYLQPKLDERGWYLGLHGSIPWHAADMARMWRHMNRAGLPTYVLDAEPLANAILGEDMLMVVPEHESIWYQGRDHFGHCITTCIHLDEDNREELIAKINWQPIDVPKLKR